MGHKRGLASGDAANDQPDVRDIPLAVKYETKPLWRPACELFGTGPTGAVIGVALFEADAMDGRPTSYSRTRPYYDKKKRHPLLSYRKTVGTVDRMAADGWLTNHKQLPGRRGWQSSMVATPKLIDAMGNLLREMPRLKLLLPNATILLRDENGFEVDVKQTREVSRMSRRVEAINEAITGADVRAANGVVLGSPMARIFNIDPSLSRGGRLYAIGTSWQNIPKFDRSRVTIDAEPVIEIDYATLHPALLYSEVGAPLPADCYDVARWNRDAVKLGLLTLINAPTHGKAWRSLAHNADFGADQPATLDDALDLSARLIDDIKRAHRPIARFFHSDAGARLMRRDSDLAMAVVSSLLKDGIVALPVHDSFLVPVSKRAALEAAMMRAAHAIGLADIRVEPAKVPAA